MTYQTNIHDIEAGDYVSVPVFRRKTQRTENKVAKVVAVLPDKQATDFAFEIKPINGVYPIVDLENSYYKSNQANNHTADLNDLYIPDTTNQLDINAADLPF